MQVAVSETLNRGKKKNNSISLLFIGQDGVGKTSLKKSLLGEESDEKEPSNIGIEFDVVEVKENDKSKPWKRASDDQCIASEQYTNGVLCKEVARKIAERKEERKDQFGGEGSSGTEDVSGDGANDKAERGDKDGPGDGDGEDYPSHNDSRMKDGEGKNSQEKCMKVQLKYHLSDDLKRKIAENVENYRGDTMDTIRFMLEDVGGQSVFYDVHSIMLRLRALFILVIDLSKSLDNNAHSKFVDKDTKKEIDQENLLRETNFDYVTRWMAALRNLNPWNKEVENEQPKTILVFTKPDKLNSPEEVDQKYDEINEVLDRRFERIDCDSLIVGKYVIKNTTLRNEEEADQLKVLRETIFKTSQEILKNQEETPIRWLMLERALDNLRSSKDHKDRPYISLSEAQKLGEQCQVNETFREAMKFFHQENIVVHFHGNLPMSDLVVLHSECLVKIFTQVFTIALNRSSRAWKKLTRKGVLNFDQLPTALVEESQKEALKDMIVRTFLTSHWKRNIYLVPSMVIKKWKESEVDEVMSSSLKPSLYVNFKDDTIPLGLYTRVQIEVLKWALGDVEHYDEMPRFRCNCCRIFKHENDIPYSLILIRHVSSMQVAISGGNFY